MSVFWQSSSYSVFIQESFFAKSSNTVWLWLPNILDPNSCFTDQLYGNVRPFSHNVHTSFTGLDSLNSVGLGGVVRRKKRSGRSCEEEKKKGQGYSKKKNNYGYASVFARWKTYWVLFFWIVSMALVLN